jgi:ATP-binding cassette, subfamily C, bacterial
MSEQRQASVVGRSRRSWRVLGRALFHDRGLTVRLVLWSAVEAVPVLVFGRAVAGAADAFLAGHLWGGLDWLGALVVAAFVGAVGSRRSYGPLAAVVEPFRDLLAGRVVRGAIARSVQEGRPDNAAVARLTHQVEIVRDTFAGMIMVTRDAAFTLAGALIGLAALAPATLILVLPPLVLGLALFFCLVSRTATRQRELVLTEEHIATATTAMAEGLRDVVACGAEERVADELGRLIDRQAATARSVARLSALRTVALAVGGRLPLLLILAGAPWLIRNGASAGTILGALTYVLQGLEPALAATVAGIGGSGLRLTVTLDRVLEASVVPPSRQRDAAAGTGIRLEGVTFAYGPNAVPVIRDLSLEVPDGDHLVVVGPSGIGKSTLAALIAGLLEPGTGSVRLGDAEAADVTAAARVLIPQEAYVFAGTLRENLAYLSPDASDADLDTATGALGLTPLIHRLHGYDTDVDPTALSAGERQLIALARAHLSAARIVILDEATCHLDPSTEETAERAFVARQGTLIVIAHRMSSARRAQRILVLDGTRAWLGNHRELLVDCPLYRELTGHWDADPSDRGVFPGSSVT